MGLIWSGALIARTKKRELNMSTKFFVVIHRPGNVKKEVPGVKIIAPPGTGFETGLLLVEAHDQEEAEQKGREALGNPPKPRDQSSPESERVSVTAQGPYDSAEQAEEQAGGLTLT